MKHSTGRGWAGFTAAACLLFFAAGCARQAVHVAPAATAASVAEKPAKPAPADKTVSLGPVYFDHGKTFLTPDALSHLYGVGSYLVNNPNGKLVIEGYADERDDPQFDAYLSQERATSVYNWLVLYGPFKIDAKRVTLHSFGNTKSVNKNCGGDKSCHEKNRRVDITAVTAR